MMNFRTFDLNLLRVLCALLDEGSTVAAARRLHMSQPAVSAALARLRHALGDPLFVRQGRSLSPTEFALSLRDPLHEILFRTEALLRGPDSFDPAQARLAFKISGSDFFAELLMPQLAERLARVAPLVQVQLVNLVPDNYVAALDQFDVEVALIPLGKFPDWADHQVVFHSQFSVIARAGHPELAGLAPGDPIPTDLFCALSHVLFSPEGKLTGMGDQALAQHGRTRHIAMTLPVFSGVYNAVAASDLIALLPRSLAQAMAPRLGLTLYAAPVPMPVVPLCMVWHRRLSRDPAQIWLRQMMADVLAPLDDPAPLA